MKAAVPVIALALLMPWPVMAAGASATRNEARAEHLFTEVRCVVCQGENIADSEAQIAADMRRDIRADIENGRTDAEIRQGLYEHYGDYVLFRPRMSPANAILWSLPPLIVILGVVLFFTFSKRQTKLRSYDLSSEDEKKLDELLRKPD